jgi:hypothetical protein
MPYRAMIATMVTVALALVAVGMWVAVMGKILHATPDGTAGPATATGRAINTTGPATAPDASVVQLHAMTRGVLILAFILILLLLFVGLVATAREWMRAKRPVRKKVRTRFVDAWKIAGERMKEKEDEEEGLQ